MVALADELRELVANTLRQSAYLCQNRADATQDYCAAAPQLFLY